MRNVYKVLENLKGRDQGVDGRIILKWMLGWEGVDWIHLAQDRDQLGVLVNTIIKLWVA
jgi:hypothetical protein